MPGSGTQRALAGGGGECQQHDSKAKKRPIDSENRQDDLSKVEVTVLELVRAGLTVERMIEVIPEPDPEIYRALVSLSESGAISF